MSLKYGTKVEFDMKIKPEFKGTGKIVGQAICELPLIGATYIIEPDDKTLISSRTEEGYTHFTADELQFKVIE